MKLVLRYQTVPRILAYIRQQEGYHFGSDHFAILSAVKERDPDKAEEAMSTHLNLIIEDIKRYFAKHKTGHIA